MRVPNQNRLPAGANMTPMIDVVFLLIIFFLVSSHLARQEHRLPLDLPVAASYAPLNPEKKVLTISVDLNSRIQVGGKEVDVSELKQIIGEYRSNQGDSTAVRIRTDGAVQYRYVEPILREAAKLGISDAAIAVKERDGR